MSVIAPKIGYVHNFHGFRSKTPKTGYNHAESVKAYNAATIRNAKGEAQIPPISFLLK